MQPTVTIQHHHQSAILLPAGCVHAVQLADGPDRSPPGLPHRLFVMYSCNKCPMELDLLWMPEDAEGKLLCTQLREVTSGSRVQPPPWPPATPVLRRQSQGSSKALGSAGDPSSLNAPLAAAALPVCLDPVHNNVVSPSAPSQYFLDILQHEHPSSFLPCPQPHSPCKWGAGVPDQAVSSTPPLRNSHGLGSAVHPTLISQPLSLLIRAINTASHQKDLPAGFGSAAIHACCACGNWVQLLQANGMQPPQRCCCVAKTHTGETIAVSCWFLYWDWKTVVSCALFDCGMQARVES
jgi:hypothetical protein